MDNHNIPARLTYVEFSLFQVISSLEEMSQQLKAPALPQAADRMPSLNLQMDVEKQNDRLANLERRFEETIATFANFKAFITPMLPNKASPTPEDLQNQINELRGIVIRLMDRVDQIAMKSPSRPMFETTDGSRGGKGKQPYEESPYGGDQSFTDKGHSQEYVEGANVTVAQPLHGPQKKPHNRDLPRRNHGWQMGSSMGTTLIPNPKSYHEVAPKPTRLAPELVKPWKKPKQFTPLPRPLSKLLPSLLEGRLVAKEVPRRNPRKFKGYDETKSCAYHMGEKGHSTDDCIVLKNKVQNLIDNDLLDFEEEKSIMEQNTSSGYQGVNLVHGEEEEDILDFSVHVPKL